MVDVLQVARHFQHLFTKSSKIRDKCWEDQGMPMLLPNLNLLMVSWANQNAIISDVPWIPPDGSRPPMAEVIPPDHRSAGDGLWSNCRPTAGTLHVGCDTGCLESTLPTYPNLVGASQVFQGENHSDFLGADGCLMFPWFPWSQWWMLKNEA